MTETNPTPQTRPDPFAIIEDTRANLPNVVFDRIRSQILPLLRSLIAGIEPISGIDVPGPSTHPGASNR